MTFQMALRYWRGMCQSVIRYRINRRTSGFTFLYWKRNASVSRCETGQQGERERDELGGKKPVWISKKLVLRSFSRELTCSQISTPMMGTCAAGERGVKWSRTAETRRRTRTEEGVLIGGCDDFKNFAGLVVSLSNETNVSAHHRDVYQRRWRWGTDQPAPAASLYRGGGRVELFLEAVERPKVAVDGGFEEAVGEDAASGLVWGEVLPEE